jgi:hypothetical protein
MSLKQWLIDYSRDVIDGRIIACQKHKWACMRFYGILSGRALMIFLLYLTKRKLCAFSIFMELSFYIVPFALSIVYGVTLLLLIRQHRLLITQGTFSFEREEETSDKSEFVQ